MCGITGILLKSPERIGASLFEMNSNISHRGPDDEGYAFLDSQNKLHQFSGRDTNQYHREKMPHIENVFNKNIKLGLGHRRLSIIETSHYGHQPWVDSLTGNVLVFNGEIYNYIELKQELIALGFGPFKTNTDTEVFSIAYRAWGTDCFNKFNGFWACAIYDKKNNQLILSRDRFGKKPLYVYQEENSVSFSSEIKSLFAGKSKARMKKEINHQAAFLYLAYDRRNTFYDSMWEKVEQVEQASYRKYNMDNLGYQKRKYWKLPKERLLLKDVSMGEASSELRRLLRSAVEIRLRSDVPLEANLSGGMDSSAIVAHATQLLKKHGKKLTTHFIRYYNDNTLNESYFANSVADYTGTNHEEVWISAEDAWEHFESITILLEEPVHSMAFFTQWIAWKKIAHQGFKVMLHGASNDELMLGYEYLSRIEDIRLLNSGQFPNKIQTENLLHWMSALRIGKWFSSGLLTPNISNSIRALFNLPDRRRLIVENDNRLFNKIFSREFVNNNIQINNKFNQYFMESNVSADNRMKADFEKLRIPFWNSAMDKSMMSIPIEVRFPFLDYRLVDYIFSLPTEYLYHNGITKYLLRHSLKNMLPKKVLWRKNKMGFSVPKKQWLNKKNIFIEELFEETKGIETFINTKYILNNYGNINPDFIWRAVNFTKWMQVNLG
jgi:asparagine synthase (glutamine-hydrolysing)